MKKKLLLRCVLSGLIWWSAPFCLGQGIQEGNRSPLRAGRNVVVLPAAEGSARQSEVDLRALRSQLQLFQQVLNRDLQQIFEHPFSLLQDVKGIYLPGYGVAFHMEANLLPLRTLSMFEQRPYTEEELRQTRDSKLARVRQLKDRLSEVLVEHSAELGAVPPEEKVAVAVHLFHLPSEQTEGLPAQLVLEAPRRALLDYKARRITAEDFRKQMTSLEF